MPATVIIGTQWGDEGKGKVVDYFAGEADIVVRVQGGANAGHTVRVGTDVFRLHHLPAGILRPSVKAVIGNGVVVEPEKLLKEIADLKARNCWHGNLLISERAHITLPWHIEQDGAEEGWRGAKSAGTTKRGIGPTYSDKVARFGIRFADIFGEELRERIAIAASIKKRLMGKEWDVGQTMKTVTEWGRRLEPFVCDTTAFLHDALHEGKRVLIEGAHGTLLDVDFGTYPYTTSSNTVSGAACAGSGIPPRAIARVIGVAKAYTTRVGAGPFPTELHDDMGRHLLEKGGEYGTTTGRARRCGWLDLVLLRYAVQLSGVDTLAVTKLDVLGGLPVVKACVAYELDGKRVEKPPATAPAIERCRPVYEELPGWPPLSAGAKLPDAAVEYCRFIGKFTGARIGLVSVGPGRDDTILFKEGL